MLDFLYDTNSGCWNTILTIGGFILLWVAMSLVAMALVGAFGVVIGLIFTVYLLRRVTE